MDTSLSYLENTEITNETQLTFQEHKGQELISKQIDLQYGVGDIITMMTLLVAVGVMVLSLISNHLTALCIPKEKKEEKSEEKEKEKEKNDTQLDIEKYLKFYKIVTIVILLGCLYYAIFGHFKETDDQISIQKQITATITSIHSYKTCKAQQEELQKLKASPAKCICSTPKVQKPCETKIKGIKPCKN